MKRIKLTESKLNEAIRSAIVNVLNESIYSDRICDKMYAEYRNSSTPMYRKKQIQQELQQMGYFSQVPQQTKPQSTQQMNASGFREPQNVEQARQMLDSGVTTVTNKNTLK